jgi:hypothetical protein
VEHKRRCGLRDMDVNSMLANGAQDSAGTADSRRQYHPYPTRHTYPGQEQYQAGRAMPGNAQRSFRGSTGAAAGSGYTHGSPVKKDQKHVVFQLIDPEDPRIQARLPMRVMISPHDTTESIITTVKNFYGLYEYGVSFENKDGIGIIAAYDNFENDMTVHVRTIAQPPSVHGDGVRNSMSPKKAALGAPFEMRPPQQASAHSPSRTAARSAGVRSMSPQSELGRRSVSAAPGGKPRVHRTKSKDNSVLGDAEGYSSGDNGEGSVTSSRRSRTEQVNAEISVENIVEGGRRKRAFESSVSDIICMTGNDLQLTAYTGTATVRATTGAIDGFPIFHLASAPPCRQCCVSLPSQPTAHLLLPAAAPVTSKLWQRWQLHASWRTVQQWVQCQQATAWP